MLPRKELQRDSHANRWCRSPRIGSRLANHDCGTTCSQLNGSSRSSASNASSNSRGPSVDSRRASSCSCGGTAQRDLGVGADQLLGVERLARVDAAQPPVRVQVDPRVDALGRLVARVRLVRAVEQIGERARELRRRRGRIDRRVVGIARRRVRVRVVVGTLASGLQLGECPPDLGLHGVGLSDVCHGVRGSGPTLSRAWASVNRAGAGYVTDARFVGQCSTTRSFRTSRTGSWVHR